MKSKIKYTDEPIGKLEIVPDFLPTPKDLLFREESLDAAQGKSEPNDSRRDGP